MKPFPIVLIGISILFFALNFINYSINEDHSKDVIHEKFNPKLIRLNTLAKLINYVDSSCEAKKIKQGTLEYAIEAQNIVSDRFYHKYATFNLNENWIAEVMQKTSWIYFSSKVKADDILTKPYGYCCQQTDVLMELLESKHLDCRAVLLPHHYVMQCYINGKWNFFDPDIEPEILPEQRSNQKWLFNHDSLAIAYNRRYKADTNFVNVVFGSPIQIKYGKINAVQAPYTRLSQDVTKPISKIAFVFPLLVLIYLKRKKVAPKHYKLLVTNRHIHFPILKPLLIKWNQSKLVSIFKIFFLFVYTSLF